ncbi:hypothetical protein GEMRC1_010637 [Eukaryota sp. GEM-RC1]
MDDISLIAPKSNLEVVASEVSILYKEIGLELNIAKCFIIADHLEELVIDDINVPFINCRSSGFRFLGCYLGNNEQIEKKLDEYLVEIQSELNQIKALALENHLKFFLLKVCYSGRITHLLRSLAPELSIDFCRAFNKIRTEFLAYLLQVNPNLLKNHIFLMSI